MRDIFDIYGNRVSITNSAYEAREKRLDAHVMRLYHQTDRAAADSILSSGEMRLGSRGSVGPGIYFAETPAATHRKAERKGVVLEVDVRLGRVKELSRPDGSITLAKLHEEGYDCVKLTYFSSGVEWIVYSPDQVTPMRRV